MKTEPRKCLQCEKIFDASCKEVKRGNAKFCSRKCSGKYNGERAAKSAELLRPLLTCSYCGKNFKHKKMSKGKSGHRFCNRQCKVQAQRLDSKNPCPDIRPSHYGTGCNAKTYRPLASKHYEKICNRCGFNDERIVVVHHKDRNTRNNVKENLEVLCPNCHALDHYINKDGLYNRRL